MRATVLPFAYVVCQILILLNILWGIAVVGLVSATLVARNWTMVALGITPESHILAVLPGLQAIAGLGVLAIILNHFILSRLAAMVESVGRGDAFSAVNVDRLRLIAWALLALQLLALAIAAIAQAISTKALPIEMDAGFSTAGWLAVIMTFVLARVFAAGTVMREDLEGTI